MIHSKLHLLADILPTLYFVKNDDCVVLHY